MTKEELLNKLYYLSSKENIKGMARFGIVSKKVLGISAPDMKAIARESGKNHKLALELWESGIYEARIIASMVAEPAKVTEELMESWALEFDNWAIVDGVCSKLFDKTKFAWDKAFEWAEREEVYVKRAGFVLMCTLAVHEKKTPDSVFLAFFPVILKHSPDDRKMVSKAINWALRQLGKRCLFLREESLKYCEQILEKYPKSAAARWAARDAIRELNDKKIIARIKR